MENGFKGTINTAGRPKGAVSKTTANTKKILSKILAEELAELPQLMQALKPKDRIDAIVKLLPYLIPKNSKIELEDNNGATFTPVNVLVNMDFDTLKISK